MRRLIGSSRVGNECCAYGGHDIPPRNAPQFNRQSVTYLRTPAPRPGAVSGEEAPENAGRIQTLVISNGET